MLSKFDMNTLREAIFVERTNARLTQEDVAASIGCSRKWVSRFERGLSVPDIEKVAAYAGLFGIDVMMRIPVRELDFAGPSVREDRADGLVRRDAD